MITTKDIEHLANLARIKIEENEKASLVKEIDSILNYVGDIKKVTVDMDHSVVPEPGAVKNITRPDVARTVSSEDREAILNEAPERIGQYVAVKKIL